MAPCVLFVDDVEKALSGVASGGRGDGGVSSRLFGTLLTWLNDHTSDVYAVMTCNQIQQLPPEFSCAERFETSANRVRALLAHQRTWNDSTAGDASYTA